MASLSLRLNEKLYLRDPQHTSLGQHMISKSVEMIDRLGFEQFTFRKLAEEISSTEASVYRYFENKHRLLHYLMAWYWNWLEYRIDLATLGIPHPEQKLRAALHVITEEKKFDPAFDFVNEESLHRIVLAEHDKTFLTKWVDQDHASGLFGEFRILCQKLAAMVTDVNPDFPYPHSLITTLLISIHHQQYFVRHLPYLTDISYRENRLNQQQLLQEYAEHMVFAAIAKHPLS